MPSKPDKTNLLSISPSSGKPKQKVPPSSKSGSTKLVKPDNLVVPSAKPKKLAKPDNLVVPKKLVKPDNLVVPCTKPKNKGKFTVPLAKCRFTSITGEWNHTNFCFPNKKVLDEIFIDKKISRTMVAPNIFKNVQDYQDTWVLAVQEDINTELAQLSYDFHKIYSKLNGKDLASINTRMFRNKGVPLYVNCKIFKG